MNLGAFSVSLAVKDIEWAKHKTLHLSEAVVKPSTRTCIYTSVLTQVLSVCVQCVCVCACRTASITAQVGQPGPAHQLGLPLHLPLRRLAGA